MIIVLFDKTEIVVTKNESDRLTESLAKNPKGFVLIKGKPISKSAIAYIKDGGTTEADTNVKRIAPPDHRGEASEAKEQVRQMLIKRGLLHD